MKRVVAWQIAEAMKRSGITKVAMAARMRTSRSLLDRLLDANDTGLTLDTLNRAASALAMRTKIVIDDKLLQDTLQATGLRTDREVIELGLRTLLRLNLRQQEQIKRFRGKLQWQGDLEAMRNLA